MIKAIERMNMQTIKNFIFLFITQFLHMYSTNIKIIHGNTDVKYEECPEGFPYDLLHSIASISSTIWGFKLYTQQLSLAYFKVWMKYNW